MAEETIDKEKFNKYIKNRYEDQIRWYDKKSIYYKRLANILQIFIIVPAAIVPVTTLILEEKWVTVILSLIVTVSAGILNYFKFEELWRNYRTTCETLKKEKHMYDFKIGEYGNTDEPQKLFVERVESLISREHTRWVDIMKKKNKNSREVL